MGGSVRVQSRKWQVTINNPLEHGFDHDKIRRALSSFKGLQYWCMCDEIGDECETLHTHVYFHLRSACTADRVNNLFPNFHRDVVRGSDKDNRAYILKDGEKFHKDGTGHYSYTDSGGKKHEGVNYSDTFEEEGTPQEEHQGKSKDADVIVNMIREGATNADIVDAVSSAYKDLEKIDRTRSMYRDEKFRTEWRDLTVTYMFGKTGSGKTRSVMEKYGYSACYRVTDYKHPFDTYDGQDVIIFEEFRGGLKHGDMLNYLDGYPLVLPCRYFNRQACYTKVYLISNIPPTEQYPGIDTESRNAFFRRIHKVVEFVGNSFTNQYSSVEAFIKGERWVQECISSPEFVPTKL